MSAEEQREKRQERREKRREKRQERRERRMKRWIELFPPLERTDRLALVNNLTEGSGWSMNFGVMLGC